MNDKCFIDTNIWVYAHLQGTDKRCEAALELLETLPLLVSSTQVLNEYYSVMLRKRFADNLIQDNVEVIIEVTDIRVVEIATIRRAHQIKLKYGFSYWDSLVIASALESECQRLYSEDMQHNQMIESCLMIVNPFKNLL